MKRWLTMLGLVLLLSACAPSDTEARPAPTADPVEVSTENPTDETPEDTE